MDFKEFLELYFQIGKFKLTVADILAAFLILAVAKFSIWFLNQVLLSRYFRRKQVDQGRQAALRQFLGYIIWVLAIFAVLETFGISSMLWASSAALLVGIGLGLQDTFKDLISGIVILVEGTVEVGDILELDGTVARVNKIGLRTSKMETRDRVSILVPNSKLVVDKVTNWSHNEAATRFNIKVGVAYGSDLSLVGNLLMQAAKEHREVLSEPAPFVQFKDFGDSSLEFELLFFTEEFFRIDTVQSDIRLAIDRLFRENKVQIPFPQRDLWVRDPKTLHSRQ